MLILLFFHMLLRVSDLIGPSYFLSQSDFGFPQIVRGRLSSLVTSVKLTVYCGSCVYIPGEFANA